MTTFTDIAKDVETMEVSQELLQEWHDKLITLGERSELKNRVIQKGLDALRIATRIINGIHGMTIPETISEQDLIDFKRTNDEFLGCIELIKTP